MTFNVAAFLSAQTDAPMATRPEVVPEGEYVARVLATACGPTCQLYPALGPFSHCLGLPEDGNAAWPHENATYPSNASFQAAR